MSRVTACVSTSGSAVRTYLSGRTATPEPIQTQPIDEAEAAATLSRVRWLTVVMPAAFMLVLLFFSLTVLVEHLTPIYTVLVAFGAAALGIEVCSRSVFTIVARLYERLWRQNQRLQQRGQQLKAVYDAGLQIAGDLSLAAVLQNVIDSSREVVNARYGGISVADGGRLTHLVLSGHPESASVPVEELPQDLGVISYVMDSGRPYRSDDLSRDPGGRALPANLPAVRTVLAVPLLSTGQVTGCIYLAEKDAGPFTSEDEEALRTLAVQAAIAIENARLYAQAQDVAVLEERERIGMDLHDGAIQALYGVNLRLEACIDRLEAEPGAVRADLDKAIEGLDVVIRDIRSYIFDLRPKETRGRSLGESLQEKLSELTVNSLITTKLDIEETEIYPDPTDGLSREQADTLARIADEALGSARNSRARNLRISIRRDESTFEMLIYDDDAEAAPSICLARMRDLARTIGAEVTCTGEAAGGKRLATKVPLSP